MKNKKLIILIIVMVVILLITSVFGIVYFKKLNKIVTTITLDINPSIEMGLNYKNEVVKINGLNEDGKKILNSENFKGDDLEDAIEEITEIVIEKGYITEENNYILINVSGNDMKSEVSNLINKEFKEENVNCNVIFQEINTESKEMAEKYGISESKASYIESIIKENNDLTFEELKDKSINEINKFIETKEEVKQEEENKKQEEQKKEENKQNTSTNNGSNSNNLNNTTSNKNNSTTSSANKGSTKKCEKVTINFENDDITKMVFDKLGLDFEMKNWYNYQTVASIYNNICAYETKIIYNKTMYKFYYNVTDGSLVHQEQTSWLAGNREDVEEIVIKYFADTYGATKEEIFIPTTGGTLNEKNKEATAIYQNVQYDFIIDQKTGVIKSVKES